MPGPNSAPNGNSLLVRDPEARAELAKKGRLITGKTEVTRGERVREAAKR